MHQRPPPRNAAPRESGASLAARLLPFLALLGANVALAFGPVFVRLADTGPVAAGFWRIALALPVLGLLAARGGGPIRLPGTLVAAIAIGGVCFAADLASWHLGILRTRLANATLLGNSATLFFPVYGFLAARRWPTRVQAVALLLAAAGAALLMGRSYRLSPENLTGDLLCLLAGILYTGYFVVVARARAVLAPWPALALSSLASVLPLLLFALAIGERVWPQHWAPLIGLALCSQVIGQGLMTYVLGRFSPLVVGIALLTQPVVAAATGWLMYDERLGAADVVGAALVAAALVLVRERPSTSAGERE